MCQVSSQLDPRPRFDGIIALDQSLASMKIMRVSSCLLHLVQDSAGELVGGGVASHVSCAGGTTESLVVHSSCVDRRTYPSAMTL
jgi:hypothetical protein